MKTKIWTRFLSIFMCLAVLLTFAGCQSDSTISFSKPGTYTATADGNGGPLTVKVTVESAAIKSVIVAEQNETAGIADKALKSIPEQIVKSQSLAVDTVSGSTITSKAILAATEDALKQAGGNIEALKKGNKREVTVKPETMEADVVVAGGGIAGLSAAIEAASQGKMVILLEKLAMIGGNSNFAEGIFGVDSPLQKELGITAKKDGILKSEFEFSNYKINSKLWEKVIGNSADNIAWLLDMGAEFETVTSPGPGEKTWHVHKGFAATLIKEHMVPKAEALGVKIMLETPAQKLIVKDGKIEGVKATKKNGGELTINSKAVVLATGGFSANKEMVAEETNLDVSQLYYRGSPGPTGDGIKMAREVGADSYSYPIGAMLGPTLANFELHSNINIASAMEAANLWVNQNGVRFVNEDVVFHFTNSTNAIQSQNKTFSVFDSKAITRLAKDGAALGYGMYFPPGTKLDKLNEEIKQALDENAPNVFKADTLEELATKMGLNPDTLVATIEKYNIASKTGIDTEYTKNKAFIHPIDEGPYYGFNIVCNLLNTVGGIKVNEKSEVLNKNNEPIKGLYAAGMEVDGFMGAAYGISVPGSTQGIAVQTGRASGENSVKYINSIK